MLLLVRHHATLWTEQGLLQGRRDEPLLQPASADPVVAARLHSLAGQPAWCSTRRRTQETAALYGWRSPVIDPILDEIDFGSFEGKTKDTLMRATGGLWESAPFSSLLRPALEEMAGRVDQFISRCRAGQGPSLVFGHGAWIRLLAAVVEHGDPDVMNRLPLPPGGIMTVDL